VSSAQRAVEKIIAPAQNITRGERAVLFIDSERARIFCAAG
jgi:hypothetical protein